MKSNMYMAQIIEEVSATTLVYLIDRSGSMRGSEESIVNAVNEMLEEQKKIMKDLMVHITTFDNDIDHIRSESIQGISTISYEEVRARGSTSLFDAIGVTFEKVDPMNQMKGVMIIVTDGLENTSIHFNYNQIQGLIKEKEGNGWKVIYMGAGLHESKDAMNIGIRKEDTIFMSKERIGKNMKDVSMKTAKFRTELEWDDSLNSTNDWNDGIVNQSIAFPDIGYYTEEYRKYIVDTGSPVSFHRNGEIKMREKKYIAQRYDLMGKLHGHTLRECEGLIGNDISKDFRLWYTPGRDEIELAFQELSIVDAMHSISTPFHLGIPTIKLMVEGREGIFFLDTGTSTTYLRPGFINLPIQSIMTEYAPMYGDFEVKMVNVSLDILPIGYRNTVTVGIFPEDVANQLLHGVDGILGFDILKQYEFVIDLKQKMFFIERKGE